MYTELRDLLTPSTFRSYMTCGLKVDTQSRGWDRTMNRILRKIKGASYDLDAEQGMMYVTGKVDPRRILRKLGKHGRHARLCWVRTEDQYCQGNNYLYGSGAGAGAGAGVGVGGTAVPPPPYQYGMAPPVDPYWDPYYRGGGVYNPYYEPLRPSSMPPPMPYYGGRYY
ncbi:putative Metal ion-binding protein [Quillaja saponaria]|uniref:Metal ion-binding protein n=1 Tax=Quillaja saponaria TaxID=32244 RepID=A0AAD7KX50_QUISA|nr:putative Metal ion-binding protein [Quillaja saponaria]